MSPTDRMARLPSASALFILSNILTFASAYPYALPEATKTVEFRELNVEPWPLATAAPGSLDDLLLRRAYNTICGYIGGDPDLPATCSAGSHCVVDSDQGVIGCCPDGGSCTQGVYTGCVDSNSGAQTEVNPYIYTCQGSDLCYKNTFEGGYSQYGCGSVSGLATTVAGTASGKSAVELTTLSVTGASTTASEASETTETSSSNTRSSKTKSETTTKTKSSTTEASSSETSDSSTASNTGTESSSATQTGEDNSSSSTSAAAPGTDGNNGSKNTGAIIGGTISGVAALVAVVVFGLWMLKRKKSNQGLTQNQPGDSNGNIQPLLPAMGQVRETTPPPPPAPMPVARGTINPVTDSDDDERMEPYTGHANPYGYGPASNIGMALSDHDETPLNRDQRQYDDYHQSYDAGLTRIEEEEPRLMPTSRSESPMGPYPGPRGSGGGPLWQQNRGPSWL